MMEYTDTLLSHLQSNVGSNRSLMQKSFDQC